MKTLLNKEYWSLNKDGVELSDSVEQLLAPIIEKLMDDGYNPAEIGHIIASCVTTNISEMILIRANRQGKKNATQRVLSTLYQEYLNGGYEMTYVDWLTTGLKK